MRGGASLFLVAPHSLAHKRKGWRECQPFRLCYIKSAQALVFGNLGDCAHRAFLQALAASDASIFVDNFGNAARNLENLLGACVYANPTTNALVFVNNRMSHDSPFLASMVSHSLNLSVRQDTITRDDCKCLINIFGYANVPLLPPWRAVEQL